MNSPVISAPAPQEVGVTRLADFIPANMETILAEWEAFARSIWPGPEPDSLILRNSAEEMLLAVAEDMKTPQTDLEQIAKSKGRSAGGPASRRIDTTSNRHAMSRVDSGFQFIGLIEEYRALRASVVRLWSRSAPRHDLDYLDDLTRFNEGIDQLMAESVQCFAARVEASREIYLGILSHDLRTPLHAVTMCANLLTESRELDAQSHKIASQILESVESMKVLVHDLLEFASARLGAKMAVSPAATDLGEVCQEALAEMQAAEPEREFLFEREGNLSGMWDAARLRQVITNLLCNAVQHGADSTPIVVRASGDGDMACLEVSNQGHPIPQESLPWIFDPMMSVPRNELCSRNRGFGLGLFIAREIVTAHRGLIDVRSDGDETVFSIRLPRSIDIAKGG